MPEATIPLHLLQCFTLLPPANYEQIDSFGTKCQQSKFEWPLVMGHEDCLYERETSGNRDAELSCLIERPLGGYVVSRFTPGDRAG